MMHSYFIAAGSFPRALAVPNAAPKPPPPGAIRQQPRGILPRPAGYSLQVFYASLFAAGLLLSMHCVGMCGGFVALLTTATGSAPAAPRPASPALLRPHLLFHAGRLASYASLGALAGALGSLSALFARAGRGQALLMIVAGAALGLIGLAVLGLLPWDPLRANALVPMAWVRRGLCRVLRLPRAWLPVPYGALLGLLPCGLIYAMLIRAAATASAWRGAAVMASFGAGAVPALLLVAYGARYFTLRLRCRLLAFSGILMLALGVAALYHGLHWVRWAR